MQSYNPIPANKTCKSYLEYVTYLRDLGTGCTFSRIAYDVSVRFIPETYAVVVCYRNHTMLRFHPDGTFEAGYYVEPSENLVHRIRQFGPRGVNFWRSNGLYCQLGKCELGKRFTPPVTVTTVKPAFINPNASVPGAGLLPNKSHGFGKFVKPANLNPANLNPADQFDVDDLFLDSPPKPPKPKEPEPDTRVVGSVERRRRIIKHSKERGDK